MSTLLALVVGLFVVWGVISYFLSRRFGWHVLQRAMPFNGAEAPRATLGFRPGSS